MLQIHLGNFMLPMQAYACRFGIVKWKGLMKTFMSESDRHILKLAFFGRVMVLCVALRQRYGSNRLQEDDESVTQE